MKTKRYNLQACPSLCKTSELDALHNYLFIFTYNYFSPEHITMISSGLLSLRCCNLQAAAAAPLRQENRDQSGHVSWERRRDHESVS